MEHDQYPPEESAISFKRLGNGNTRVFMDARVLARIGKNVVKVNEILHTNYTSFLDMCEQDPTVAYSLLRGEIEEMYNLDELRSGLGYFLPTRDEIGPAGEVVEICAEVTDADLENIYRGDPPEDIASKKMAGIAICTLEVEWN